MNSIGIVILTHNQPTQLEWIIESIDRQTVKPNKVVIINNNSTKEYPSYVMNRRGLTVCNIKYDKDKDYRSLARNKGIELCKTDIICFLDGDIIPDYRYLETVMLYYMDKYNSNSIIMPNREEVYNKEELERRLNKLYDRDESYNNATRTTLSLYEEISRFASFAFAIKRNLLIDYGMFPEEYNGWGFEDIDLFYRLQDNGVHLFINRKIKVYHVAHPRPEVDTRNKDVIINNAKILWSKFKDDRTKSFINHNMRMWGYSQEEIHSIIGV